MKFIVYETLNTVNGKRYRGAHIMRDEGDEYLGSGRLIKKAIVKYGFQAFQRTVLAECESIEHMFEIEAKLVDAAWVADSNTYNLKIGGEGGWDYINKNGVRWNDEKRRLHAIEMKKRRNSGEFAPTKPTLGMLGKKHRVDSCRKISKNSAKWLDFEQVEKRKLDLITTNYPIRGSVKILSEMWNVSHTQVKRFADKIKEKV